MQRNSSKVVIIDYGMGNLFSVQRACEHVGLSASITSRSADIAQCDGAILPGVGAFGDAMNNLKKLDLIAPIKGFIENGKPFMGICLGFQLLMTESEEFGSNKGLDIFKGKVINFPNNEKKIKVPQVGWNQICKPKTKTWEDSLLKGIKEGEYMYFVHSYCVVPEQKDIALSMTNYEGFEYCSSVSKANVFACQFHPERSANRGLHIYGNFASAIQKESTPL